MYIVKVDIGSVNFSKKTIHHIETLFEEFGYNLVLGRGDVMDLVGLKRLAVSKLLTKLLEVDIIEPVAGHGKESRGLKKGCAKHLFNLCAGHGMSSVGDKPTTGSYRQV